MSTKTVHLIFPCCTSQNKIEKSPKTLLSSAISHLIASVTLAIIVGIGVALAAYYTTQGEIVWIALAGGGGAVLIGVALYVLLRCTLGNRDHKNASPKPIHASISIAEKVSTIEIPTPPVPPSTVTIPETPHSTTAVPVPSPITLSRATLTKVATAAFHKLEEYGDPFADVQSQEQFETQLTQTILEVKEWKGDLKAKKKLAQALAKLSLVQSLCKHPISEEIKAQIHALLTTNTLPQGLRFPLQQLADAKTAVDKGLLRQQVHCQDCKEMRSYYTSGMTKEKNAAINASIEIEGYDGGEQGIRMAVHQKPGPRTAALIVRHADEYLSGRKRFVFKPRYSEEDVAKDILAQIEIPESQGKKYYDETYNLPEQFTRAIQKLKSAAWDGKMENTPCTRIKVLEKVIDQCKLDEEVKNALTVELNLNIITRWTENQQRRREVMLYLIDALETDRKAYYARRPDYLNVLVLDRVVKDYNEKKCPHFLSGSSYLQSMQKELQNQCPDKPYKFTDDERYLFEVAAQKLQGMRQQILDTGDLEEFEKLADTFRSHYRVVYRPLPTISLTVAATISPDVLLETAPLRPVSSPIGKVPEILRTMLALGRPYRPSVLFDFEPLIHSLFDAFQEAPILQNLRAHIDRLNCAVLQSEYYVENVGAEVPQDKIDPMHQPKAVFESVKALRTFIHENLLSESLPDKVHIEAESRLSYLQQLEEAAVLRIVDGVREKTIDPAVALPFVEGVARANGWIDETPLEEFLQNFSDESLMGYRKIRQALYNSEIAHQWMSNTGKDVDTLCQTYVSNLNCGLMGALSQLAASAAPPATDQYIGGWALSKGAFYGTLAVEPNQIEEGRICVLEIMPHHLRELRMAAGLIIEEGGPLSHAANIARELKIPAIIGAKGAVQRLKPLHGERVRVLTSDKGNTIEKVASEKIPDAKPNLPMTRIWDLGTKAKLIPPMHRGKGGNLILLAEACQLLPKIQGVDISVPPFEILNWASIQGFYDTSVDQSMYNPSADQSLRLDIIGTLGFPNTIRHLIEKQPFPDSLEPYGIALKMGADFPLIARSSASVEDGASSYSGLFTSVPNITTREGLEKGVKEVLASAFSPEIREYSNLRGITDFNPFDMEVILQQYVADASISGVGFSQDPLGKDTFVHLQIVRGVGGGVDAQGHPDETIVDVHNKGILEAHPGREKGQCLLSPDQSKKVSLIIKQLEQLFGYSVDVEFAIKIRQDNTLELSLLQIRPITTRS